MMMKRDTRGIYLKIENPNHLLPSFINNYIHSFIRTTFLTDQNTPHTPFLRLQLIYTYNFIIYLANIKMQFSNAVLAALTVASSVFAAPSAISKRNTTVDSVTENLYTTVTTLEVS